MLILSDNKEGIVMDVDLNTYAIETVTPEFIVYDQLVHQLHLPIEKWTYTKKGKPLAYVRKVEEAEEMDQIQFEYLDYTSLVYPLQLYTYFLLQELIGNGLNYSGFSVLRGRKDALLFNHTPFNTENMAKHDFGVNEIGRFVLRKGKKKELLRTHESFFVLLDQKFRSKVFNALILYQSETGDQVDKNALLDVVLNPDRISALSTFSLKEIARL